MRIVDRWAHRALVVGASIFIALLGAARAHAQQPAPAMATVVGGFRQGAPIAGLRWDARPGSALFVVGRRRDGGDPADVAAGARARPERRPHPMPAPAQLPIRASTRPPTD